MTITKAYAGCWWHFLFGHTCRYIVLGTLLFMPHQSQVHLWSNCEQKSPSLHESCTSKQSIQDTCIHCISCNSVVPNNSECAQWRSRPDRACAVWSRSNKPRRHIFAIACLFVVQTLRILTTDTIHRMETRTVWIVLCLNILCLSVGEIQLPLFNRSSLWNERNMAII